MDLAELGKQFGLDAAQTQAAIDALAPVVAAGIRRNTQDDGGFADLISALARVSHASTRLWVNITVSTPSSVSTRRISRNAAPILRS